MFALGPAEHCNHNQVVAGKSTGSCSVFIPARSAAVAEGTSVFSMRDPIERVTWL